MRICRGSGTMVNDNTALMLEKYLRFLLDNSDSEHPKWNQENLRGTKSNDWNYVDACMIKAVLSMYDCTKDKYYLKAAESFLSGFVSEDGSVRTYDIEEFNLDHISGASNLITLYELTGKRKYRKAIELFKEQLKRMPRTNEGNFWHKKIYPNQVWLDGLYMAQPFYMEYETRYNKMQGCKDSFMQFCNVEKRMKDPKTGLYYHGYDESKEMYWANPKTGCSPNFWLRAIGWYAVSLVETAEVMDESLYYERRTLQKLLWNLAEALLPWQHESGMFYQIVDRPDLKENYLETSGTALISYALLKGARLGFLSPRFAYAGERAFKGILDNYLKTDESGNPVLGGICLVAGLGGEKHRDGSLKYYFSEPVVENEAKGIAPLFLAYTEILRIRGND